MQYRWLKIMALLEGTSLLLLLFIAMPLKYHFGMPEVVSWVGRAHGGLFIAFNLVLASYVLKGLLSEMQGFKGFLASLLPFGTFIYKAKVLK
jgi:integral membrane protein